MTISMYHASTPLFLRMFGNMNQWLDMAVEKKGAAGAEELLSAKLAPDMLPLLGQFQRASDTSKGCIARLAGVDAPAMPDTGRRDRRDLYADTQERADNADQRRLGELRADLELDA